LTVFNRSNDVLWGAYGANVVQFSTLLEWVAGRLGVSVGTYTQVSNSFHVYTDTEVWQNVCDIHATPIDPYNTAQFLQDEWKPVVHPFRMQSNEWHYDLGDFMLRPLHTYIKTAAFNSQYFNHVVVPLYNSFTAYKQKDMNVALAYASQCHATDWRMAVEQWLLRKAK